MVSTARETFSGEERGRGADYSLGREELRGSAEKYGTWAPLLPSRLPAPARPAFPEEGSLEAYVHRQ